MVADLFHPGHVRFLNSARALGDYLIVGLHSDKVSEDYKRKPILTLEERVTMVSSCRYVDQVIPNAPLLITKEFMEEYDIDLVVHAHDESEDEFYKEYYLYPDSIGKFKRLDYNKGISTTEIIDKILNQK